MKERYSLFYVESAMNPNHLISKLFSVCGWPSPYASLSNSLWRTKRALPFVVGILHAVVMRLVNSGGTFPYCMH